MKISAVTYRNSQSFRIADQVPLCLTMLLLKCILIPSSTHEHKATSCVYLLCNQLNIFCALNVYWIIVSVSLKTAVHCKKLIHSRKYDCSSNTFRCNSTILSNRRKFRFNFRLHFFITNGLYFRKSSRLPRIFVHLLSPPCQPSRLLPEPQ